MKHFLFTPLFLVFLFTCACNPKVLPSAPENNITVKEVYTQKEIPGQQDGLIRDYLKMTLAWEVERDVMIDELIFRGKLYVTNSSQRIFKIDINAGAPYQKEHSLKANEALLFYTYKGAKKILTIRNIETREPLYLP